MISIEENISLKKLNTFGIDARTKYFAKISALSDLDELLQHPVFRQENHFVLGGGSNVLFTGDFKGLMIHSNLRGINVLNETENDLLLEAGSGESWHDLVVHCVRHQWGGIENLSLIPGTVGAAPIQNIGAYGMEIQQVVHQVDGIDLIEGKTRSFNNAECRFSYRESVFKQVLKEKFFISSVTLRLTKKNHLIRTEYGAIQEVLRQQKIADPTIADVSNAVISIRRSKLPDPAVVGNAGSFFKNPTVREEVFAAIKKDFPGIPHYQSDNQSIKIPAGWLIEQCGWKGKKFGNVGVHPLQALVLVNYGGGKGEEIFQLATKIQESVREKFGIVLTREVNVM